MVQEHYLGVTALLAWHRASSPLEIWRIWTSAGLHWSPWHLGANLLGCLVLAAWGRACNLGVQPTMAWLLAWPMTQASLWLTSDIQHYGGLSGVLHAGVAIGAAQLLTRPRHVERRVGLWVLLGLCIKLLSETPITAPAAVGGIEAVPLPGAPGYSVAYQVHWAGSLAGLLSTALIHRLGRRRCALAPAPHGVISS